MRHMHQTKLAPNNAHQHPPKKITKQFPQLLLNAIQNNHPKNVLNLLSLPVPLTENFPINDTTFHTNLKSRINKNTNPEIATHLLTHYESHRLSLLHIFINCKDMHIDRVTARSWCQYLEHINWRTAFKTLQNKKIHLFSSFIKNGILFKQQTHLFSEQTISAHLLKSDNTLRTLIILCAAPTAFTPALNQALHMLNSRRIKTSVTTESAQTLTLLNTLLSQLTKTNHDIQPFKKTLLSFFKLHENQLIRYLCILFLSTHKTNPINFNLNQYLDIILARLEDKLNQTKKTSPKQTEEKEKRSKRKSVNINSLSSQFSNAAVTRKKTKTLPLTSP
jgi:hypothetical protein